MQMSFLDFLQSSPDVLKSSIILNQFALFATPFDVDAESVSEEVQMELLNLQCDTVLKQTYTNFGVPEFYMFLSREQYPKLVSAAAEIMAMFGSTYVCEQFFSSMKINKSALRSRLTDEHLHATLQLATTRNFKPDVDFLVAAKSAGIVRWRLSTTEVLNYIL